MALTSFNFTGADWTDPDPRDARYWECISESMKDRCSHVSACATASALNTLPPPTENSGIPYERAFMDTIDAALFEVIPKYYDICAPSVTCSGATITTENGRKYISRTYIPYTSAGRGIFSYTVTYDVKWTVDSIMKVAGLNAEDGALPYGNTCLLASQVKRWLVSRYNIIRLLRVFASSTCMVCFKTELTAATRLRYRKLCDSLNYGYERDPASIFRPGTYCPGELPVVNWQVGQSGDIGYASDANGSSYDQTDTAWADAMEVLKDTTSSGNDNWNGGLKGMGGAATCDTYYHALSDCSDAPSISYYYVLETRYEASQFNRTVKFTIWQANASNCADKYVDLDTTMELLVNDVLEISGGGTVMTQSSRSLGSVAAGQDFEIEYGYSGYPFEDWVGAVFGEDHRCTEYPVGSGNYSHHMTKGWNGVNLAWTLTQKFPVAVPVDGDCLANKSTLEWE
jgi:hypothetical protein